MAQEYTHKTLILNCRIFRETLDKNRITIKNPQCKLDLLTSIIKRKFKCLQTIDESSWTICINSQFIHTNNELQFKSLLAKTPPPAVINIVWTTPKERFESVNDLFYYITVHLQDQQFIYKLNSQKQNWNEYVYNNLLIAITNKFHLHSTSFKLYECIENTMVDIDDICDIKIAFNDIANSAQYLNNDEGRQSLHLYVIIDMNKSDNMKELNIHQDNDDEKMHVETFDSNSMDERKSSAENSTEMLDLLQELQQIKQELQLSREVDEKKIKKTVAMNVVTSACTLFGLYVGYKYYSKVKKF
eukprot:133936_1